MFIFFFTLRLVVVDFWATWCGPCRMFAPTFEAMALREKNGKNQVIFLTICESDSRDAMEARNIRAFPTFHLYLNGNKVEELTGANEMSLLAAIEKHRNSAAPLG